MQIFHTPTSMIVILDNRYNITFYAFLGDTKFKILIIDPFKGIIYVHIGKSKKKLSIPLNHIYKIFTSSSQNLTALLTEGVS